MTLPSASYAFIKSMVKKSSDIPPRIPSSTISILSYAFRISFFCLAFVINTSSFIFRFPAKNMSFNVFSNRSIPSPCFAEIFITGAFVIFFSSCGCIAGTKSHLLYNIITFFSLINSKISLSLSSNFLDESTI